jgi:hypothetical protein
MILSLCLFGVLLAARVTLFPWDTRHTSLLSPIGLFSMCFIWVHFVVPALQHQFGVGYRLYAQGGHVTNQISAGLITLSLYYLMAVLVFLLAGPPLPRTEARKLRVFRTGVNERGLVVCLTVLALGSAAATLYLVAPYLGSGYVYFMVDRITSSGPGKGYLLAPVLLAVPARLLMTLPMLALARSLFRWPLFLALMLMVVVALCSMRERNLVHPAHRNHLRLLTGSLLLWYGNRPE